MGKNIDLLLTEQVKTWVQRQAEFKPQADRPAIWPLITISREFGAQGAALAAVLHQRTGFTVWDKDLVHAVAEKSGAKEKILKTLDEHRRKTIDDVISGALMGSKHTNVQYLRTLMRVVHTIAAHGQAIVVGRGANYICAPDDTLRVRVVCTFEERVAGYARRQKLDLRKARRKVKSMDADRADFLRYHFKRDGTEPADYDVVLNAGVYRLENLADIVLAAYEAKVGWRPPKHP